MGDWRERFVDFLVLAFFKLWLQVFLVFTFYLFFKIKIAKLWKREGRMPLQYFIQYSIIERGTYFAARPLLKYFFQKFRRFFASTVTFWKHLKTLISRISKEVIDWRFLPLILMVARGPLRFPSSRFHLLWMVAKCWHCLYGISCWYSFPALFIHTVQFHFLSKWILIEMFFNQSFALDIVIGSVVSEFQAVHQSAQK